MPPPPPPQDRVFIKMDHWFQRAQAALLGELPCWRGCHSCCIGPFAITQLDVAALTHGMGSLAPELRQDIQEAAQRQVAAMEEAFPHLTESPGVNGWNDGEVDLIVEKFADLPCPALGSDGSCRVYPFRPVTCRAMGVPVEEGGMVHGACEVQIAVPIVKLPRALREEEDRLATAEATMLQTMSDEVLLPYGFLSGHVPDASPAAPILDTGAKGMLM